ncbi:hypothetical protein BU16DRAFT_623193 [Lophium mytilinum]|uniref:Uncharacterized protein n=1 Tax=Lophium mytilinum TaxID=390894 RepID=A0A6A6Q9D8_9PEZI|nr:hypothetical protein BU16DRAFT_623193 [Lophium mytilinum]
MSHLTVWSLFFDRISPAAKSRQPTGSSTEVPLFSRNNEPPRSLEHVPRDNEPPPRLEHVPCDNEPPPRLEHVPRDNEPPPRLEQVLRDNEPPPRLEQVLRDNEPPPRLEHVLCDNELPPRLEHVPRDNEPPPRLEHVLRYRRQRPSFDSPTASRSGLSDCRPTSLSRSSFHANTSTELPRDNEPPPRLEHVLRCRRQRPSLDSRPLHPPKFLCSLPTMSHLNKPPQ